MFCFKDLYRYSYKTHHKSIISILSIGLNTVDIKLEDIKLVRCLIIVFFFTSYFFTG